MPELLSADPENAQVDNPVVENNDAKRMRSFRDALQDARNELADKTTDQIEQELYDALDQYVETVKEFESGRDSSANLAIRTLRGNIGNLEHTISFRNPGSDESATEVPKLINEYKRKLKISEQTAIKEKNALELPRVHAHNRLAGLMVASIESLAPQNISLREIINTLIYLGRQAEADELNQAASGLTGSQMTMESAKEIMTMKLPEFPNLQVLLDEIDVLALANARRKISENEHKDKSGVDLRILKNDIQMGMGMRRKFGKKMISNN